MPSKKYTLLQLLEQGCMSEFTLFIVTSIQQLKYLATAIKKAKVVCINIQGTELDPTTSTFAGMSIAMNETEVYFIPRHNNEDATSLSVSQVASHLQAVFTSRHVEKIIFNREFNSIMLERNNMHIDGPIFDITVATQLVIQHSQEEIIELLKNFYTKSADTSYKKITESPEPFFVDKDLWRNIAHARETIVLGNVLKHELQCLLDNVRPCKHE